MSQSADFIVREATDEDAPGIRGVFTAVYGGDYPYPGFFDEHWLKRSVFNDEILMLVAVEIGTGVIVGTASVVFDSGAHSDLVGEFGRLAVRPEWRGRGVGGALMGKRIELVENRIHVGVAENRAGHDFSQRISERYGFAPVGFIPLKHRFDERESIVVHARHFSNALELRRNHPRMIPEASELAHLALERCGLEEDAIIDDDSASYPYEGEFEIDDLTVDGLPALLRIERGRVRNRELFGPMRLQYGYFMLSAHHATYLVAREAGGGEGRGPIAGALGFIRDDLDRAVRIFELICRSDRPIRFLLERLLERCREQWGVEYVDAEVSAFAPRMQRTLLELGFLPASYIPALVFHQVERLDVIRMVKLMVPFELGQEQLTEKVRRTADLVARSFGRQKVLPRIAEAVHHIALFQGLNEEQVGRVAGACTVQELQAGAQLFRQGEPAGEVLILLEGKVEVRFEGSPRPLGWVGPGESLGEVATLTGEPHSASALACLPVVAAVLSRAALGELARIRPDIGVLLYRNLAVGLGRKLQRLDVAVAHLE